jgi:hypothetical protein
MRRATGLGAGLVLGLAVFAGCGPEKQLPTSLPDSSEKDTPKAPQIPTKSEPEAVKLVDRCVKAATDGHPERLERAKAVTQSAKGAFRRETGQFERATRHVQAVWPNLGRVTYDFLTGDIKQFQLGYRKPDAWAFHVRDAEPADFTPPNMKEYAEIIGIDLVGLFWMPMLVPLVDPTTVVFGAKTEMLDNQPAEVVQVSVPGCPVFSLWVDGKTTLPKLITFTHNEGGTKILKRLGLADHKPFGGVLIPTTLVYARNSTPVEEWTITACTFVDKIDDATFNRPADRK